MRDCFSLLNSGNEFMIEYIFFHALPCDLFTAFLTQHKIAFERNKEETDVEGLVIAIADDLNDDISEKIETYYDQLMEMDEALLQESPDDMIDQAGLSVTLNSGKSTFASVKPDVLNRMLTVVSRDEIAEFIDAIVNAVETPDQRPLCKR